MKIDCPLCGRDVRETKVDMEFGARMLPLFQCVSCPKTQDLDNVTFVLLSDGAKLDPRDVFEHLARLRAQARDSGRAADPAVRQPSRTGVTSSRYIEAPPGY